MAKRNALRSLLASVLVGLLMSALLIAGCSGGGQRAAAEKVLKVGMWSPPKSLNPLAVDDAYSTQLFDFIYPKLFRFDHSLEPVPYLATSWDITPDGKTYTFHLSPDAVWEDGEPVTSADVAMTLRLMADKGTGALLYTNLQSIVGIAAYHDGTAGSISGITTPDVSTVVINLKEPNAAFLGNIYYYILPEHILGDVAAADIDQNPYFKAPVGAGPFKLVKYETGQYAEFAANDKCVLGRPKVDRLYLQFGNQDALMASLEKGELDVAPIAAGDVERFKDIKKLSVISEPSVSIQMLHVNSAKPYLADKRVRQAFAYALDRQGIVDTLLEGQGTVVDSHYLSPEWAVSSNLKHYDYNPDKAKQLLSEAGWDSSREIVLRVPTGDKAREGSAPIIKAGLESVGVKVKIEMADFPTVLKAARSGDFDLTIIGWPFGLDPDMTSIGFESKNVPLNGWNIGHYANDRVDELLAQGRLTTSLDERRRIYHEYQEILNEDLPWIPLFCPNNIFGVSDKVTGVNPITYYVWGQMNPVLWNVNELEVTQ